MPLGTPTRELIDWDAAYEEFGEELRVIEAAIEDAESRASVELTPDAVEMLLIPFLVEMRRVRQIDEEEASATVKSVIQQSSNDPDRRDTGRVRSAFSIIRAWWRRWCDIPPICRPTK